jgi:hypothetical protein
MTSAKAAAKGIRALRDKPLTVMSIQDYGKLLPKRK